MNAGNAVIDVDGMELLERKLLPDLWLLASVIEMWQRNGCPFVNIIF